MATIINRISISIDGETQEQFRCSIGGTEYFVNNIELEQKQTQPNRLTFYICSTSIFEKIDDATFTVCAQAVGKPIVMEAASERFALLSFFSKNDDSSAVVSFQGIITKIEADRCNTAYVIKVTAHSYDYLLTLGKNCKSFSGMTLKEIAEDILGNYGGDIPAEVNPMYTEELPYTVQYEESDYDFLKRLAATYNEWLYCDGEKLIFGNIPQKGPVEIAYRDSDLAEYQVETKPVNLTQEFIAKDYHANMYSVQTTRTESNEVIDVSDHPLLGRLKEASEALISKMKDNIIRAAAAGNYDTKFEDMRNQLMARNQAARKLTEAVSYSGTTYCAKIQMGAMISLKDTFIGDTAGSDLHDVQQEDILITELVHKLEARGGYSNTFAAKPYQTRQSPGYAFIAPPTAKSCTATVVDNEDPEQKGRIRIQFDWQETYGPDMITPWLRIVHPYAGGGKGFSFIPEIGEEVMVAFAGGNPDKPYVLGTLYNGSDEGITDPAWLPGDNQIKAIRTRNGHTIEIHDEGDDGYIRIYDHEKENYILTFSTDEKLIKLESTGNIELYAKNDIIMHAGNDIEMHADNDIREQAGSNRSTQIGRNDVLTVGINQTVTTGGSKAETVAQRLQVSAGSIHMTAKEDLLESSTTHQQKASDTMTLNAGSRIEAKAALVKIN